MSDTSVEQKLAQEMKKTPAKGNVTAVISLAGQKEDFVSEGWTTERRKISVVVRVQGAGRRCGRLH